VEAVEMTRNTDDLRPAVASDPEESLRSSAVCPAVRGEGDHDARVLLLAGDGIGPEIMEQVRRVVTWFIKHRAVNVDLREELYGVSSWKAHGEVLREQAWNEIRAADAILFGATGSPEYDGIPAEQWQPDNLLRIRRELDLFANLRPICMSERLSGMSTLRPEVIAGADLLIVRELAGGIYFGLPRGIENLEQGGRRAFNTTVYTSAEIERVARIAFELARSRRRRVCSVDKANVCEVGVLWREVVQELADAEYPDVDLQHMYVDNAAMQLVRAPRQFDVLLTENLFGDILSDCAAMVAGSIGMLPSASLGRADAQGHRRALYEPIHGSAPDIAGTNVANPIGAILSFAMCLEFSLGSPREAQVLRHAVDAALETGIRTRDIAFAGVAAASTVAMGDAVMAALEAHAPILPGADSE
jgi:3-isopropylmalate dehydrogenase